MSFIKHIYWLTKEEIAPLEELLAARGLKLKFAKGVVCTPLDEINKISCVAPEVWDETCARQGSWYRASDKNGLFLVVSSFDVEELKGRKAATLTQVDFHPPKAATLEDKRALVHDPDFDQRVPPRWRDVGEVEKRVFLRWARRLGSDTEDFELLYLSHTANHANFLKPRYFLREGDRLVPYSIDRSAHLCSCCLELFQVLGAEYEKKLVAPCPGATIFARLGPDKFLLVEAENTGDSSQNTVEEMTKGRTK
jgi:hypothetical protein